MTIITITSLLMYIVITTTYIYVCSHKSACLYLHFLNTICVALLVYFLDHLRQY